MDEKAAEAIRNPEQVVAELCLRSNIEVEPLVDLINQWEHCAKRKFLG